MRKALTQTLKAGMVSITLRAVSAAGADLVSALNL